MKTCKNSSEKANAEIGSWGIPKILFYIHDPWDLKTEYYRL